MGLSFSADAQLDSLKDILNEVADRLDMNVTVKLWNGDMIPMGRNTDGKYTLVLSGPGVIGSMLRRPTLETLVRLYASGHIGFEGGDLMEFADAFQTEKSNRRRLKEISKWMLVKKTIPFIFARTKETDVAHQFADDMVGRIEANRNNTDYIQFHYDVSNDFYKLFLGGEMVYTCAYFKEWDNSLEQAQRDKMDLICRKLRLQPGDKMLDIGCGWGGLIRHAAMNYGVKSHGITLSQEQHDYTQQKIDEMGLGDQVSVEICDYADHTGNYDKISSVGMSEHIGTANYPRYFNKINSLLRDRGLVLNHAIARRAKATKRQAKKIRPERKFLLKYIFPGSELIPVGTTTDTLENTGFEVHDVESLREHYALTLKYWSKNLTANKEEAIRLVGPEKYRLWAAYMTGGSVGFTAGSIKIYQVLASKRASKGLSGLPPTRADLYRAA
ncbi:MAG TPA: SAM-dependent methyltransferase [Rhodopirellula sp.]|nr:MAG: SAM-dependent methyltransferase [Saprospirales bacterium TMED214]HBV65098.1 SAM-dependent methyltransferase [Rhodopirellula sp.]